ncbi:hypothetical protein M0813_28803 [Anaeramoeba flamelloides]|uniref:Uncharacterized protein n=1 Tax=Anaeramoeba flamelloides TaxID=1746091 RepID=A0ABQ8XQL1_9EUKA|nr:hypothetical protein M0813_28803 [Anaeramoeba flamelloides]
MFIDSLSLDDNVLVVCFLIFIFFALICILFQAIARGTLPISYALVFAKKPKKWLRVLYFGLVLAAALFFFLSIMCVSAVDRADPYSMTIVLFIFLFILITRIIVKPPTSNYQEGDNLELDNVNKLGSSSQKKKKKKKKRKTKKRNQDPIQAQTPNQSPTLSPIPVLIPVPVILLRQINQTFQNQRMI